MNVANALLPAGEKLSALAASPDEGPVVMVNLLKYRDRAAYADGRETDLSGREAYRLYAMQMLQIVIAAGGRVLFAGTAKSLVIGQCDELWDDVALVEYPSRKKFLELAMSPEVAAIAVHREAGLEGQLLIESAATTETLADG